MTFTRRELLYARRRAMRALVDSTHWIPLADAAELAMVPLRALRRYLSTNPFAGCSQCPAVRPTNAARGQRFLSPAEVRAVRRYFWSRL
jgi:hypothetical protein